MTSKLGALALGLILMLGACSGGDSESEPTGNALPSVDAGEDRTVVEGSTIQIDATVTDPDSEVSLLWTQISGPVIDLSDPNVEDPSFTAPEVNQVASIALRLSASDGINPVVSDVVVFTVLDGAAIVDAGFGRIVPPNSEVQLNANLAEPFDTATLAWTQLSGPAVTLDDATAEDPIFTAPDVTERQTLVFQLRADNGVDPIVTDTVSVEIWVAADATTDRTVLGDFSGIAQWRCDQDPGLDSDVTLVDLGGVTVLTANSVPRHSIGTFPNARSGPDLTAVTVSYDIINAPQKTDTATEMAQFGVSVDGVAFEREPGATFRGEGVWTYEALTPALAERTTSQAQFEWFGTDCNNGFILSSDERYRYVGLPEGLINRLGEQDGTATDMIFGGLAADGFPVYLRYAYSDPDDAGSGLSVMAASWEIRAGTRDSAPGGAFDGAFREDWEYVEGSGDLDECNGRTGVTPEFPDGTYYYVITDDYPYIPRCVFGTPDDSFERFEEEASP